MLRFNLKERIWVSLRPLKTDTNSLGSSDITCVSLSKSILFTGKDIKGVYEYKHDSNCTPVFDCGRCWVSSRKLLFKNEMGVLFYLTDDKIYVSSESNYAEWHHVGSYNKEVLETGIKQSSPQLFGDFVSFVGYRGYVRFNHKNLVFIGPLEV